MKIIRDFRNDLLKRRELEISVEGEKNPGMSAISESISKELGVSEEVVAVKFVHGKFGSGNFLAEVFVYDSADDKNKIEPRKKEAKK